MSRNYEQEGFQFYQARFKEGVARLKSTKFYSISDFKKLRDRECRKQKIEDVLSFLHLSRVATYQNIPQRYDIIMHYLRLSKKYEVTKEELQNLENYVLNDIYAQHYSKKFTRYLQYKDRCYARGRTPNKMELKKIDKLQEEIFPIYGGCYVSDVYADEKHGY